MADLFEPLSFRHGSGMKNRFMLAPLTNTQSHKDGRLSDDEYKWLTMRAQGGFGLTMTCAAHVQAVGQGFPGQLGIFSDAHLEGLTRLARGIKEKDSLAVVQLHHAGMRTPQDLVREKIVAPSDDPESGARGLSTGEVQHLVEDFIVAAERAQSAGFDGVEIHGAHSYILCQFLSETINRRKDAYGGSPENRSRVMFEIADGIRQRCGENFSLGIRLSPERFDLKLRDIQDVAQTFMSQGVVDYIDMSLWDIFKEPEEEAYKGRSLMSYFTQLDRGDVRLGVAGKVRTPDDACLAMERGADFVLLGRAAILHHDFPNKMKGNANFEPVRNPVTSDYLRSEGLGESFISYMGTWRGFVQG
jgi:2,4-dienoyl-CoA reductase-like NADH-dependent reductase (Old Yellow Enzyme family)